MIKKVVLSTLVTVSIFANTQTIKSIDVNKTVQDYISAVKNNGLKDGGWIIKDRKIGERGESFISYLSKDKNDKDNYKELIGATFQNDINYTKDSYKGVSTLIDFPVKDLDKNETQLVNDIIKNKLIVINSDYSSTNHKYNISLKDINRTLNNTKIKTQGINLTGLYDINNPMTNHSQISIKNIDILPLGKKVLGEYLNLENLIIESQSEKKDKIINLEYKISMNMLDSNISNKHSLVDKLNLHIKIANLDAKVYEELEELSSKNPSLISDKEIDRLISKLISSKGLFIEIVDFSVNNIIDDKKVMGSTKITAKVSLDDIKNNAKFIASNPMMALSFLNLETRIELSQEMINTIMRDPRAMMLAILPPKKENNKTIYVIKYSKGKLNINGQKL
ncbi:hypothetical protein MNB_SV-9-679 [hydrothermal vent metagenome]|uniref:Uncharacterized protein n=1 Tax=hydrothermal vent metagenome TaxID=652676 RepID=A0A1W1BVU5_9ZZZZ